MEKLAAEILERYEIDFASMRRAGGWTNGVWLGEHVVLRLAQEQGSDRIRREAALGQFLPEKVGYRKTITVGVEQGFEWSLSEYLAGESVYEAWPKLDIDRKMDVLRQTWEIIASMRSMDPEVVAHLVKRHPWYSTFEPDEAHALLERLVQEGRFSEVEAVELARILEGFYRLLPGAPTVVNHGDVTVDNLLLDSAGRVHLLDFEHALIGPAQVDTYSFLRMAFQPEGDEYLTEAAEAKALQEEAARLVRETVSDEKSAMLLLGVAALISLKRLTIWLEGSEDKMHYREWEPYLCLASLTDGRGGFLSRVVEGAMQ